jgi:class 3 adenylate cyclase
VNSLALSHTVIAFDIVNSSGGDRHRQAHLDQSLQTVFDAAVRAAGDFAITFRRPDGDSMTIAVPAEVPKSWLAADFVLRELPIALARFNRAMNKEHRLRVRIAMDHGEIVVNPPHIGGDPVTTAARLLDADELRSVLDTAPAADFALIVSERFYRDVIRNGERGLDPELFREAAASVKNFHESGWIHAPGRAAEPRTAVTSRERAWNAEVVNVFEQNVDAPGAVFGVSKTHGGR